MELATKDPAFFWYFVVPGGVILWCFAISSAAGVLFGTYVVLETLSRPIRRFLRDTFWF